MIVWANSWLYRMSRWVFRIPSPALFNRVPTFKEAWHGIILESERAIKVRSDHVR